MSFARAIASSISFGGSIAAESTASQMPQLYVMTRQWLTVFMSVTASIFTPCRRCLQCGQVAISASVVGDGFATEAYHGAPTLK